MPPESRTPAPPIPRLPRYHILATWYLMLPSMNFNEESNSNYEAFRDCLSGPIIQKSALPPPARPRKRKAPKPTGGRNRTHQATAESTDGPDEPNGSDAEDLADFIDVPTPRLHLHHPLHPFVSPSSPSLTNERINNPVPRHRNLHLPASRPARPLPHNPTNHPLPARSLQRPPPGPHPRHPPNPTPPLRPRLASLLRPPPRPLLPPHLPGPHPSRLHRPRHRAATALVQHAHVALRDLPPRLDPADVPPSDPQAGARQGGEAGVVRGVAAG